MRVNLKCPKHAPAIIYNNVAYALFQHLALCYMLIQEHNILILTIIILNENVKLGLVNYVHN